ncbi:MAG: RdgB/HAM1 family non-canonical purine NTP pyrophosphatase [Sorangiineae bacterium]|nr:RdgB/HAM1 family non-canonical purine NTP pyrophosphatase [Sorangiineae bacterium]
MSARVTVVLATRNAGKVAELRALLSDIRIDLVGLADLLPDAPPIREEGETLDENAACKAREACRKTRLIALADDSGLEVDALGGRPGVRSARFAHEHATDAENNTALLRALEGVDEGARAARFRCVLALSSPWADEIQLVEGRLAGEIARAPRGSGGFGYDPLFIVEGSSGRALAELTPSEKNAVSHRARAARALRPFLLALLEQQREELERIAG